MPSVKAPDRYQASGMLRLAGVALGPTARRVLGSCKSGCVLSSHSKGVYCCFGDDILLVQEAGEEVVPFGILLASLAPLARARAGSPLHCSGELLCFHHLGIVVDCANAPTPQPVDFSLDIEHLPLRLERLVRSATALGSGSAMLLANHLPVLNGGGEAPPELADVWARALWNPLRNMAEYCKNQGDQASARRMLHDLLGLGPGLTPLGDDIICGAMVAARELERNFPFLRPVRENMSLAIQELCSSRTTPQSAAFLKSAAKGESFILLLRVMRQLFGRRHARPASPDRVSSLRSLLGVGHSSGQGFLLGIMLVAWQTVNNPGHRHFLPTR